ncbi:MAG: T9SS type A sorting domain-containing protein, partial [Flavobacteriales bacterium]
QNSALETRGDAALKLWPNPNRGDLLNVSLLVPEELNTITMDIFDLSGTRVSTRTIPAQGGVLSAVVVLSNDLAAGMYMVNITVGERTYTQRLVIQP